MTGTYHIEEGHNRLQIKVKREISIQSRLLVAGLAGVFTALFASNALRGWPWLPISIVVSLVSFVAARGKEAELNVANVEILARGSLGRRTRTRTVYMADICWLEFKEPALTPAGLYAVTTRSQHCVLPLVDYRETAEIVRRIEATFPGLAEDWRQNVTTARG